MRLYISMIHVEIDQGIHKINAWNEKKNYILYIK